MFTVTGNYTKHMTVVRNNTDVSYTNAIRRHVFFQNILVKLV